MGNNLIKELLEERRNYPPYATAKEGKEEQPTASNPTANTNQKAETAQPAKSFPHKYKDILNDVGTIDKSSPENLLLELKEPGIFYQPKTHRYWVDGKGRNCFMVYARALAITWGGDSRYWRWSSMKEKETGDVSVDVAELLDVCWLEVHGNFDTGYLTPETEYEVSYVIKVKDPQYGWENIVDFSLTFPQDPKIEQNIRKRDLRTLTREQWNYISVGEFTPSPAQAGQMDFMLRQLGQWKKGLVIKGVVIRPKN